MSSCIESNSEWIYWLSGRRYGIESIYLADFRQWANITINNAIANFQSTSLLINQPMTRNQFQSEINLQIDRFLNGSRNSFAQILEFYQDMIQGNALMSFYATNWMPIIKQSYNTSNITVFTKPILYNSSCSCSITPSSLSCFYSNSYLVSFFEATALGVENGTINPWYSRFYIPEFSPLNGSSLKHFSINDTFKTIVNELFIGASLTNISYEPFFNECAVHYCSYSIIQRFNFLYVLTTFLSLFTGISLIFRIIIPHIGTIMTFLKNKIRIKLRFA
ncbi:hypothetical protein I4U23_022305 [Adineta vaga]|nr:hypothetical protein I4U23_022305 [Adineta vaga]